MTVELLTKVTPEGQLELPPEVREQLQPGDEYQILVTDNQIILNKVRPQLTWDELSRRIEEQEPDPNQLSMEEICEIVKEVRREMGGQG